MRAGRCLLLAATLAVSGAMALAGAAGAQAQTETERIIDYSVDMTIGRDGSLTVAERIDYDFGPTEHHGIFRDIPVRFRYDDRYDRVYPLDVLAVTATPPGTPDDYDIETEGSLLRIRIGDPDTTITGRHTYTISYRVKGTLNGFRDHDELYWNAVGQYWQVPIRHASIRVTGPARFQRVACFSGATGSTDPCSTADFSGRTASFEQAARPPSPYALYPYEGVTVVVGFPRGAIPRPRPILDERWSLTRAFAVTPLTGGLGGGLLLLLVGGVGWLLWTRGRDRRAVGSPVDIAYGSSEGGEQPVPLLEGSAYPVEYAPPDDIRPGQVGTLIDEVANPLDATATVVDLAVRGYVRIEEIPKKGWFGKPDWRLVKLKDADGDLLQYERLLLDGLFEDPDEEEDSDDGVGITARPDLPHVRLSSLKQKFAARLNKVQEALYSDVVKRKWFADRPDKVRQTWAKRGWLVLIAGGGLTYLLASRTHLGLLAIPVDLAGLALIAGAHAMPRRTPKGTGLVRRVFGFRTYIETAEAQEARFQERENIFSKYLPFAVVFGATEKWARAFAGIDGQLPSTAGWYVGSRALSVGSFTSSMDSFAVTAAGTISSTASSSGSSGFGGGGSSGGGGGGGGGGSW
jgi:predicted membrane protein DUF2207